MNDVLRLVLLQDANTRTVLLGAAILGLTSGVIGSFSVLRRRALLGDALAHAALPGVCVAYFIIGERSLYAFLFGAFLSGILGVLLVTFIRSQSRIKEDAAIGLVLSGFFGLGISLSRIIQNEPSGNRAGLDSYIFGKAASMVWDDVLLITAISVPVLIITTLLFKEFRILCFDRDFAASQGWPVTMLDILLMGLICSVTIVGLPAVGVVLMAALLIIPGASARFWTNRLSLMVIIAGAFGLASGLLGTALSALVPRFAAGPLIVLFAAAFFLFSLLFAPRRGVLAEFLRSYRFRRTIALQHVLRALYEQNESTKAFDDPLAFAQLLRARSWNERTLRENLSRAQRQGYVIKNGANYSLTRSGLQEARRIVRNHRLWETYLIELANIAPDHVDRDADELEHILSPKLIGELEAKLRAKGRFPEAIPPSPHQLEVV